MSEKMQHMLKILRTEREHVKNKFKGDIQGIFGYHCGDKKNKENVELLVDYDDDSSLFDVVGMERYLKKKLGCKVHAVSRNGLRKEHLEFALKELISL